MANIYLKVSQYVAAYTRADGEGRSVPPSTPLTFPPFVREYALISNGLCIIPETQQHKNACYSDIAWNKMLRGKDFSGIAILNRRPDEYLNHKEICTIANQANNCKAEAYDFLCIKIPDEVFNGRMIIRTNRSYSLSGNVAKALRRELRYKFIMEFQRFQEERKMYAKIHRITIPRIDIIEQFLMFYNMPVSHTWQEQKTLVRLADRWDAEAKHFIKHYTISY